MKIFKNNYVIWGGLLLVISLCISLFFRIQKIENGEQVLASTVVQSGDFRLTAENRWDKDAQKNYADLEWDAISDLSQEGYRLFQSEDGTNWNLRSLNYGKQIKVLSIYPNTKLLKNWIESLVDAYPEQMKNQNGQSLIDVTEVSYEEYNNNPNKYLKDTKGEYQYDVLMFGTWDSNFLKDLNQSSLDQTAIYLNSGRGILWGHDTLAGRNPRQVTKFGDLLGVGYKQVSPEGQYLEPKITLWSGSEYVEITNNGYLMKYPFELANNAEFNIPYAHSIELQDISVGTVWLEFTKNSGSWPNIPDNYRGSDGKTYRNGWYLKTNNNVGMIQTGHSNGASTLDERKIIANTLYNLAQVSLENRAKDQTVKDDQAPKKPEAVIRCGKEGELNIRVDATDRGKDYQWYIEANTKSQGQLTSDIVQETIISNIAGYFYEVNDSSTSSLKATVEGKKDGYGRIAKEEYDLYVAPEDDSLEYETTGLFNLSESRKAGRYLHIVAVDRANNVSEVSSIELDQIEQYVDFEVERTGDEAKLVELKLDPSLDGTKEAIEIQVPKNAVIMGFDTLTLPQGWYSFENSETADARSFTFAIKSNNGLATIQEFLEELQVCLNDPVDQEGMIRLAFQEKIYTNYEHPDGTRHYYTFVPEITTWYKAYNLAKKMRYRGLEGYLATITAEKEHDFIYENIAKNGGWLGGTRGVRKVENQIQDDPEISEDKDDYDLSKDDWYWANGPETGQIFYIGKERAVGVTPPGMYSAFAPPNEPNNANDEETVLQFALTDKVYVGKMWNDLPAALDSYGIDYNSGFYVEFSAYNGQTEEPDTTDVCWGADIPQKISLKAYDEQGNELPSGDQLFDQALRIGQQKTIEPLEIPFHDFIKLMNPDGTDYIVSKSFQEGKLIYGNRKVSLHIRQVILEKTSELPVPETGYGRFITSDKTEELSLTMSSSADPQAGFRDYLLRYQAQRPRYRYQPVIPAHYQLAGYVLTTDKDVPHSPDDKTTDPLDIDVSQTPEFWMTVYLTPVTEHPSPYSWDHKLNDMGRIKVE